MLVATTCRIQRWPANLMKMRRHCFRRNAIQPLAPGLPATPSSNKRPPPVLPPVAMNLKPAPKRFPKKPLQQWSGFVDLKRAPTRAPFRRKVCKTGSATGQASLTTVQRYARKLIASRPIKTEAGENPAQSRHETKGKSSRAASRFIQKPLLPEGSRGSRFHLSAVLGIDVSCFGFRGIRSKRIDAPQNPPC